MPLLVVLVVPVPVLGAVIVLRVLLREVEVVVALLLPLPLLGLAPWRVLGPLPWPCLP